jgi:very-short-patch-repair endonuclease
MRKTMTDAELKFWNAVRAHRLMGLSFRRQLPIAGYIVDFACPEYKLVIEIDGSTHGHGQQITRDVLRDERLSRLGWHVIRVTNEEATRHLDDVCTHILRAIEWANSD